MESEELVELMEKAKVKGIAFDKIEEQVKTPYSLLELYANSGPVPVTIINNLKKLLEDETQ
ncbi:hypothetical protein ACFL7M_09300 [Thermodesulfobacteriota bacterium]